jgi:hypothetical protein
MNYVSSGAFRRDLEQVIGQPLEAEPEVMEDDEALGDPLSRFPTALRTELEAMRDLTRTFALPKVCVLSWGDFCSVPELTGEERDEVLEDWFSGDESATDFVMSTVDIVNGGGGFFIVVNVDGRLGLVCEDPHSFEPLDCSMESFLRALLAAHQAVTTRGLDAARAELEKVVDRRTARLLLTFAGRLAPKRG